MIRSGTWRRRGLITLKSAKEIEKMTTAGDILAECHRQIADKIKPGVTTIAIDAFVEEFLEKHGATPEQKGYQGFPYATCASVNDEICHGFPRQEPLVDGDIVTIDMVVNKDGWLADSAWSYRVGQVSETADQLLHTAEDALYAGIEQAVVGHRLGDVGHAIQSLAEGRGFSVVRQFIGHGIGSDMHEEPQVPHFGKAGKGQRLKEGMVITIEPMINTGAFEAKTDDNQWTARTIDGGLSAQYEHTVAITKDGPVIMTEQ